MWCEDVIPSGCWVDVVLSWLPAVFSTELGFLLEKEIAGQDGIYSKSIISQKYNVNVRKFPMFQNSWNKVTNSILSIRTYYNPEIIKDNGHLLHLVVKQANSVIETSFELTAVNQFDQVSQWHLRDTQCITNIEVTFSSSIPKPFMILEKVLFVI